MDQSGNPYGSPVAAIHVFFPGEVPVLTTNAAHQSGLVRFPGGDPAGDYLWTLTEAINDEHMSLRVRQTLAGLIGQWECFGVVLLGPPAPTDPSLTKRVRFQVANGPAAYGDPREFTLEAFRTLGNFLGT